MVEDRDASVLKDLREGAGGGVSVEARYRDAPHGDAVFLHRGDELQGLLLVGRPVVGPELLLLDVPGVNAEDHLGLVAEGLEKAHLHVGVVAREAARGVVVVRELAAELEIQLVELLGALQNLRTLRVEVPLVVEPVLLHCLATPLISSSIFWIFGMHLPHPPPAFV